MAQLTVSTTPLRDEQPRQKTRDARRLHERGAGKRLATSVSGVTELRLYLGGGGVHPKERATSNSLLFLAALRAGSVHDTAHFDVPLVDVVELLVLAVAFAREPEQEVLRRLLRLAAGVAFQVAVQFAQLRDELLKSVSPNIYLLSIMLHRADSNPHFIFKILDLKS